MFRAGNDVFYPCNERGNTKRCGVWRAMCAMRVSLSVCVWRHEPHATYTNTIQSRKATFGHEQAIVAIATAHRTAIPSNLAGACCCRGRAARVCHHDLMSSCLSSFWLGWCEFWPTSVAPLRDVLSGDYALALLARWQSRSVLLVYRMGAQDVSRLASHVHDVCVSPSV